MCGYSPNWWAVRLLHKVAIGDGGHCHKKRFGFENNNVVSSSEVPYKPVFNPTHCGFH
jgi:hypothetical protein